MSIRLRFLLALLGAVVTTFLWLWLSLPSAKGQHPALSLAPAHYRSLNGPSQLRQERLHINGSSGTRVVILSRKPFQAKDYSYLKFDLQDTKPTEFRPHFFWRTASSSTIHFIEVRESPLALIDLARQPNWQGTIIELGFLLPLEAQRHWSLGASQLFPPSRSLALVSLVNHWFELVLWSQYATNYLLGEPADKSRPGLQQAILLLVTLGGALFVLLSIPKPRTWVPAGLLFLALGWLILDGRWLYSLWRNAQITWNTFGALKEEAKYTTAMDASLMELVKTVQSQLSTSQQPIYLPGEPPNKPLLRYYYARLPYLLAPRPVYTLAPGIQAGHAIELAGSTFLSPSTHKPLNKTKILASTPLGVLFYFEDKPPLSSPPPKG